MDPPESKRYHQIALDPDCRRILKYSRLCLENLQNTSFNMISVQNQLVKELEQQSNLPKHVAIIMDGNRRWAKKQFMSSSHGHQAGAEIVESIVKKAIDLKIEIMTLFAFSTENWKRNKFEVDYLFSIFEKQLRLLRKSMKENGVQLLTIGDLIPLPKSLKDLIDEVKNETAVNKKFTLVLAFNYGARDEILRAVKKIVFHLQSKELAIDSLDESVFSTFLDTAGLSDPDLIIRTSGEKRVSNFLLWQSAYSEFYTADVLWPDFKSEDLEKAVLDYCLRQRRKGA